MSEDKKMSADLEIRPLTEEDLQVVERWAETAQWWDNPATIRATWVQCRGQWVGATLNGKLIGCFALCTEGDIMSGGYLVVDKSYRKQGIATRLLVSKQEVILNAGGMVTSFTAIDRLLPTYKRLCPDLAEGFGIVSAVFVHPPSQTVQENHTQHDLTLLLPDDFDMMERLVTYDADVIMTRRADFLSAWCGSGSCTTLLVRQEGRVIGYGCLQAPVYGNPGKIGPLYGDTPEVAMAIFNRLLTFLPDGPDADRRLSICVIKDENSTIVRELKNKIIKEEYSLTRIYTFRDPNLDTSKVFALTDCGVSVL